MIDVLWYLIVFVCICVLFINPEMIAFTPHILRGIVYHCIFLLFHMRLHYFQMSTLYERDSIHQSSHIYKRNTLEFMSLLTMSHIHSDFYLLNYVYKIYNSINVKNE